MPTRKTRKQNRLVLPLLVVLLLAGLAGLYAQFKNYPPLERLTQRLGLGAERVTSASYLFTEGAGEVFALAGNNLAVASQTLLQLLAPDGTLLATETVSMEQPAVTASGELSVFYDIGQRNLHILRPDGSSRVLETENEVLFADTDEDGRIAVVTRYPDYRGRVTVYSAALAPLFAYDSGQSGYPLCARLAGGKKLAVCCVSEGGSVIRFFATDQESELGSYTVENELIWDVDFLSDGTAAAISESALLFLNTRGELRGRYDFGTLAGADYCLSGDFAAAVLHSSHSGSDGLLVTVDSRGEELGRLALDRAVVGLSGCAKQLLVQYDNELTLYNDKLADDVSYQRVDNVRRALLRRNGSALLLTRYGVNYVPFN